MDKKILSFGMAAVSALSAVTPAIAVEQHSGDGNKVPVELTVEKPTFSVTVPTGLPVAVDAAGKVYCSTNATIKNNTFGQVKVSNVTIEGNIPWTVADWALDMQKEKVNTTKIAMQLNNGVTGAAGYQFAPENFPVMDGHGALPLTYDAKLPAQTKVISGDTVANVVFTVGWNTDGAETPAPAGKPHSTNAPLDKKMMGTQLADLTGTITFSREKAPADATTPLNSDGSVVAKFVGQDATVYSKDGGGVAAPVDSSELFNKHSFSSSYDGYKAKTLNLDGLDTSKVTDMNSMFLNSAATSLDLSSFDTSKVTSMGYMFSESAATVLDLSSFDTSKVMNMGYMFSGSNATTITGLSSFDTIKVTDMIGMFYSSQATALDLSSFDTRNVMDMHGMFWMSDATTLDVSSFDTSQVTDMSSMFCGTAATTIDVSNFDTSKVTNMSGMFYSSQATTIYCRTQPDKDKMVASSNRTPAPEAFIVGKPA